MPKAKEPNFEQAISELEEIVNQLEEGELPLEEALRRFEKGVKLSASCQKLLDDAHSKVAVLLKGEDGRPVTEPMDEMQVSG